MSLPIKIWPVAIASRFLVMCAALATSGVASAQGARISPPSVPVPTVRFVPPSAPRIAPPSPPSISAPVGRVGPSVMTPSIPGGGSGLAPKAGPSGSPPAARTVVHQKREAPLSSIRAGEVRSGTAGGTKQSSGSTETGSATQRGKVSTDGKHYSNSPNASTRAGDTSQQFQQANGNTGGAKDGARARAEAVASAAFGDAAGGGSSSSSSSGGGEKASGSAGRAATGNSSDGADRRRRRR